MQITIPQDKNNREKFVNLSKRYSLLHEKLEIEQNETVKTQLIDEIHYISSQFQTGNYD
jgi:hypothetical protein